MTTFRIETPECGWCHKPFILGQGFKVIEWPDTFMLIHENKCLKEFKEHEEESDSGD